jgi:hypothetical protein
MPLPVSAMYMLITYREKIGKSERLLKLLALVLVL